MTIATFLIELRANHFFNELISWMEAVIRRSYLLGTQQERWRVFCMELDAVLGGF